MATTQNTFNGDGSNLGPFSFTFKWLESTDIKVSVGGVLKTAGTHYNLQGLNYTTKTGGQVLFTAGNAPPTGTNNIRIYRDTDDEALSAVFSSGSAIRAKDLNDNFTQNLYVTQEINNNSLNVDGSNPMVGPLNMNGFQIDNLAEPTENNDAATKSYVDARFGTSSIPGHTRWRKVATASQTTFSGTGDYGGVLAYSPTREQVYINGALQQRGIDYAADNGTSVVFTVGLTVGDVVDIICVNNLTNSAVSNAGNITYSGQFTGQTARTVAAKLTDVVSVKDFGAVGDGVTDDTAAFVAACALTGDVYVPPGTYNLTPSGYELKVFCRLFGARDASIINISINGLLQNGFCMQSGSSLDGLTINRNLAVLSAGADGNAVACWPSGTSNPVPEEFSGISLKNLTINLSGQARNGITFLGNVRNFELDNISVNGVFLHPILLHWRRLGQAPFDSYHPHNGSLSNITCTATNPGDGRSGPYFAATHDIDVTNVKIVNCEDGIVVAAGDIGGLFAVGESVGRILSNMSFKNISVLDPSSVGFWVAGRSDFQASISNRWHMTDQDYGVGIEIDGLTIECGPSASASTEPVELYFAKNVTIRNLNVYAAAGEEVNLQGMWAVWLQAAVSCSLQGLISASKGVRSVRSLGCSVHDSTIKHNLPTASVGTGDYGITCQGAAVNTTTAAAVSLNDTTITLATVPTDIYPGMTFSHSGNVFRFAGSACSGDTNVVVKIAPAVASIASGQTIAIQDVTDSFKVERSQISGFYRNINLAGVSGANVKNCRIDQCSLSSPALYQSYIDRASNVVVTKSVFEDGNRLNNSSGYDIALRNATGAVVEGNTFGSDLDNKSVYNVYSLNGNVGATIQSNIFLSHNPDTTTFTTASSVYLNGSGATGAADTVLASNYFGPSVINPVLPAAARRSITVGNSRIGFATAAPTAGVWTKGDQVFNLNAAVGATTGWVCTVSGEPGTWVAKPTL